MEKGFCYNIINAHTFQNLKEETILNDSWIWAILLQLIMLGLNAYFACAEIAVISVNENHINKLIEEGRQAGRQAEKDFGSPDQVPLHHPDRDYPFGLPRECVRDRQLRRFADRPVRGRWLTLPRSIAVFIITVLLSYITLVCGELVPKRLARQE